MVVRAENDIDSQTLFKNSTETEGLRPNTEPRHRSLMGKGGLLPLFVLGRLIKGYRVNVIFKYQTKKK